ncbi:ZSCA2 protein, partial [Polypterus senegalus]
MNEETLRIELEDQNTPKETSKICQHLEIQQRSYTGIKSNHHIQCGKTFSKASTLQMHQRLHTEHPYVCPECGRTFRWSRQLKAHRRIHPAEKLHQGSACEGFSRDTEGTPRFGPMLRTELTQRVADSDFFKTLPVAHDDFSSYIKQEDIPNFSYGIPDSGNK